MLAVSQGLTSSGTDAYTGDKRYPAVSLGQLSSGRTANAIGFTKPTASEFECSVDTRVYQDSFQLKESADGPS